MFKGNGVAGFHDDAFLDLHFAVGLDPLFPAGVVVGIVGIFFGNAVVVKGDDGEFFRDIRRAAEMIDVEMGGDEVIDLLDADIAGGFDDAFGIAFAGHAGIDEDGFTGGSDDERCSASFDIDPVQVE